MGSVDKCWKQCIFIWQCLSKQSAICMQRSILSLSTRGIVASSAMQYWRYSQLKPRIEPGMVKWSRQRGGNKPNGHVKIGIGWKKQLAKLPHTSLQYTQMHTRPALRDATVATNRCTGNVLAVRRRQRVNPALLVYAYVSWIVCSDSFNCLKKHVAVLHFLHYLACIRYK